jgi:hypothetical protein
MKQPAKVLDRRWDWRTIRSRRAMASVYGVYAGLIGIEHGYFETQHGSVATGGTQIMAVLPPGLPFPFGHEPAMTIIPNFLVTGLLAMLVGLLVAIWSGWFIQRKGGGILLSLLSVVFLLVGGGYAPISFLFMASIAGLSINSSLSWLRSHLSTSPAVGLLARAWLSFFIITMLWVPVEFILGYLLHLAMDLSVNFSFPIVIPLVLSLICGFAHDFSLEMAG